MCADLFADADLSARCRATVVPADRYPQAFSEVVDAFPPGPWMYTGAIENHPALVDRLATRRPLWGNDGATLAAVRDPAQVSRCLADADLPHPECRKSATGPPAAGTWLMKPVHGANGTGIVPSVDRPPTDDAATAPTAMCPTDVYYQQRIDGPSCAAVFVGDGASAELLGVTRQLVGETALGAEPFAFCGSVGPLPLDADVHARFAAVGRALTERFRLRGLFGVDCVLRDGIPWPVEVNPRYTASVEVIEHATGVRALALHSTAFAGAQPNPQPALDAQYPGSAIRNPGSEIRDLKSLVGKAVLYAPYDLIPPDLTGDVERCGVTELPSVADIPHAGQTIRKGHPILTVFATAEDVAACREALLYRAREVFAACRRVTEPLPVGATTHV